MSKFKGIQVNGLFKIPLINPTPSYSLEKDIEKRKESESYVKLNNFIQKSFMLRSLCDSKVSEYIKLSNL